MKTLDEIDAIMQTIPAKWRTHWCGGERGPCACIGCVQIGNRLIMAREVLGYEYPGDPEHLDERMFPGDVFSKYKITRQEWERWMASRQGGKS